MSASPNISWLLSMKWTHFTSQIIHSTEFVVWVNLFDWSGDWYSVAFLPITSIEWVSIRYAINAAHIWTKVVLFNPHICALSHPDARSTQTMCILFLQKVINILEDCHLKNHNFVLTFWFEQLMFERHEHLNNEHTLK